MSETPPPEFFALADRMIGVANSAVAKNGLPLVNAAFTFAAARFNAHAVVAMVPQAGDNREATIALLIEQYRSMLNDNIEEAIAAKKK